MPNQILVIGIIVGIFLVGIGIGYAVFQSSNQPNFTMMTSQQMTQMMNNPQQMTQWHQTMMNNPQAFNNWMNTMMSNPQYQQQMYQHIFSNQQFMQGMMSNPQFQNQWSNSMMGNWNGTIGSYMNSGMTGYGMMGTPVTKQSDVITTINKIESILDQVAANYHKGDKDTAFSQATSAYLENYEYIESAIAAKDLKQMEKIELLLRVDLRHIIQSSQSEDTIDAKIDSIKAELESTKKLFS